MSATCECLHFFFFNDTATTEIYTLSLHDALPIYAAQFMAMMRSGKRPDGSAIQVMPRSEEHTSELQSRPHLVCRLLLEKKKKAREQRTDEALVDTSPFPHAATEQT